MLCNGDKTSQHNTFETLYKRAINPQNVKAQYYVGECYAKGLEVKKNSREAKAWFEKAARSECFEAMVRLYEVTDYDYGEKEEALRYVIHAANHGCGKAIEIIADGAY